MPYRSPASLPLSLPHNAMASDLENRAKEAFVDGNFEFAADLLSRALEMDPRNADLYADRAQANLKLGNFTEAVSDANKAIELDPSMSKAYLHKGASCIKLEEYQTAKAALEVGASLVPGDARFTRFIRECDEHIADEQPQPLPFVRETVLKKRKANEEWVIKKRESVAAKKQQKKESLKLAIKRPEEFVKEYRDKELDLVRMKRRQKLKRSLPSDSIKSKLLFIIRIHGSSNDMHPKTRTILNKLRLSQILNGVFLKANEANLRMLLSIEPFVTYGYPNLKSVKQLIYKKGRGRMVRGEQVPLTDNNVIEQALGKYGIICLEDVVHEIATVGLHFKEVAGFLWPFKLKCPERRLQMKKKPYKHGGDTGNREDGINELIDKLN